jgi:Zn-dependent protease with chaperone function
MTVSYLLRLLCVGFSAFFAIHLVMGAMVMLLSPLVARLAGRLHAAYAAHLLFVLRLFPALGSAFIVLAICIPSFVWFENEVGTEEVGWLFLGSALAGGAVWLISVCRGLRALARSFQHLRRCQDLGRRLTFSRESLPTWVLDRPEPFLMLAGLFRPRLVVSQGVLDALTSEQLAAALKHERAHWTGRDNLKRLVMVALPGLLPGFRGFGTLESTWSRYAEWAADDLAVAGDGYASVSLAGALVRVARLGTPQPLNPLVTSLLADGEELSARVHRLLHAEPPREFPWAWAASSAALASIFALAALQPPTLRAVHTLIEHMVH